MTENIQIRRIILAVFFTSLVWAALIPLWHFPDEQAHFAQVQDYAELKTVPMRGMDTSWEIVESTRILGTLRDEQGHNLYTPIPGYQLPLSDTRYGFAEQYLKDLDPVSRTTMVKQEAPHYPPLYYIVGAFAYQQYIEGDLFSRVFLVRLVSVLLMACMSLAGYLVAKELFPSNPTLRLASTIMIGFQPMLMFVGSGVNNDILMNVIGTLLIAKSLAVINRPFTKIDLGTIAVLIIAAILTKQLLYLLLPSVGIALVVSWYRYYRNLKMLGIFAGIIALVFIGYWWLTIFNQGFWLPYWPTAHGSIQQFASAIGLVLLKLYKETFAWYWGVYKWLGLVLPLWLLRAIKLMIMVAVIGGAVYLWRNRHHLLQWKYIPWYWVIGTNLIYIAALIGWEASVRVQLGFGHGIQGRYFFPLISTQMALLAMGWWQVGGKWLQEWFARIIAVMMVSFNLFSLWYVLGAYYDRFPLSRLVMEISQYKPEFFKWPNLLFVVAFCFISLAVMLYSVMCPVQDTETKT